MSMFIPAYFTDLQAPEPAEPEVSHVQATSRNWTLLISKQFLFTLGGLPVS